MPYNKQQDEDINMQWKKDFFSQGVGEVAATNKFLVAFFSFWELFPNFFLATSKHK